MLNVSKTVDTSQTKRITTDSLNADFVSSGKVLIELGLWDTYGPRTMVHGFFYTQGLSRDLKKDGNVWTNRNCENVEKQSAVPLVKMKIEENQNHIMDFHQYGARKNVWHALSKLVI